MLTFWFMGTASMNPKITLGELRRQCRERSPWGLPEGSDGGGQFFSPMNCAGLTTSRRKLIQAAASIGSAEIRASNQGEMKEEVEVAPPGHG